MSVHSAKSFLIHACRYLSPDNLDVLKPPDYKDRVSAEHDYEVNLKAMPETMALHDTIDLLREKQWSELIAIQQEQLRLLS